MQELASAWAGGLCSVGPRVSSFVRAGEQVAVGCHLREEDASVMNDRRAERKRIRDAWNRDAGSGAPGSSVDAPPRCGHRRPFTWDPRGPRAESPSTPSPDASRPESLL